ncbi:MAG: RNA methyltransferase [Peptostreptococcaceae bacterium]|nr:RNA methyltransferase [Peptostreptococcaceae bacterium]
MISIIESADNKKYKFAKKLKLRKYRERLNAYLIEGVNLLEEAIKVDAHIEVIFVCEGTNIADYDKEIFILPKQLFSELSDTETSQGIIAVVEKPKFNLKDINISSSDNVIVLDRLQDPGNIGTIIRTAVAAGYKAIFTLKGTGDVYSPKTVRATAGVINRIPIIDVDSEEELIGLLRNLNIQLVTTSPSADKYYYEYDLTEGIALVIGNEGNGINDSLIEKSDINVLLPMCNNVESLNAAVAAGIIMYEAVRKNY